MIIWKRQKRQESSVDISTTKIFLNTTDLNDETNVCNRTPILRLVWSWYFSELSMIGELLLNMHEMKRFSFYGQTKVQFRGKRRFSWAAVTFSLSAIGAGRCPYRKLAPRHLGRGRTHLGQGNERPEVSVWYSRRASRPEMNKYGADWSRILAIVNGAEWGQWD